VFFSKSGARPMFSDKNNADIVIIALSKYHRYRLFFVQNIADIALFLLKKILPITPFLGYEILPISHQTNA
jgi:hypothetical protein